ncbi:hypothetical protein [Catenisphaera adipataccumulans]|jgi:3-isopropylmalate dehydratase small subunit|uniref:3-isopropylmalate dehydratase small subunit n=1 Tax=Catenisphaera adipataccumulans TaxID=700500 RepID=A0A7W8CXZ5_9FIRM|nr:hypothetical protein [Catenisphaera adipataccumulans]MBB5183451.1 3-isopropylmalate dehydratase small subunit [Catenisphaera adipataccumulans]
MKSGIIQIMQNNILPAAIRPHAILTTDHFGIEKEEDLTWLYDQGVRYILAAGFSAGAFRNCVDLGIFPIELRQAVTFQDGQNAELEINDKIKVNDRTYSLPKWPDWMCALIADGGLIGHARKAGDGHA